MLVHLQIQGQILPAPVLQYGQRNVQTDKRPGSWEPGKYSVPGKMPSYAIASFADRRGTENAMNVSPSWLCPCSTFVCRVKLPCLSFEDVLTAACFADSLCMHRASLTSLYKPCNTYSCSVLSPACPDTVRATNSIPITSYWCLQDFIINLLDECAKVGITDIGESIPEISWHQGGNRTVEDTLINAVDIGAATFGKKPALILILLPGNGKQPAHFYLEVACLNCGYALLTLFRSNEELHTQEFHDEMHAVSCSGRAIPRPLHCLMSSVGMHNGSDIGAWSLFCCSRTVLSICICKYGTDAVWHTVSNLSKACHDSSVDFACIW